jgi:DNA-binding response OmpR family regulator
VVAEVEVLGDGVELLCSIKDQDVFKPIVILMSGFMDTSIQDLHNMGADAYFSKPFETERILETAQELILKKSLSI